MPNARNIIDTDGQCLQNDWDTFRKLGEGTQWWQVFNEFFNAISYSLVGDSDIPQSIGKLIVLRKIMKILHYVLHQVMINFEGGKIGFFFQVLNKYN